MRYTHCPSYGRRLNREQLLTYRTAPWTTSEDFEAFLSLVAQVAVDDLVAMLKSLTDKALSGDAGLHRRRCSAFARLAADVKDRTLFPHYLNALKLPDRQLRATLAPLMVQVTGATEQAQLCELLRSNDEELRALAVRILKQVGGRAAMGVISSMVAERDFAGRREALALVVSVSGQHSIPALAATLRVGRPAEKRQALHYLADRKNVGAGVPSALAAVAEALADRTEAVVIDAISAYSALCTEPQYFETLAHFLDNESPTVVAAAVAGLQRFDSARAVQALERKLLDGPTSVRLAVLATMEAIGSDLIVHRTDWKLIDNPFATGGDPVLLLAALSPDIAALHAVCADVHGNIYVGRRRVDVGHGKADAQRLAALNAAQEAHDREQLGRFLRLEHEAPRVACMHEAGALTRATRKPIDGLRGSRREKSIVA